MDYFSLFVKIAHISKWSYSWFWMTWSVTWCSLLAVAIILWHWSQCCCYAVWWKKKISRVFFQSVGLCFGFLFRKTRLSYASGKPVSHRQYPVFHFDRFDSVCLPFEFLLQKELWFYLVTSIWLTLPKSEKINIGHVWKC